MRSLSTVTTLAACVLALAGCPKPESPETPRHTRLTLWHIQTAVETGAVISDAVGRFEEEHADVAVKSVPTKNDAYKDKLDRAMASAMLPDVFHTWGGGVLREYADRGFVAELTESFRNAGLDERIAPAAMRFTTFDGRVYAVPMDVSVVLMWYNRELFERHGVTVPRTFDELRDVCRRLRAAGVIPIALGNRDKWPGAFYYTYLAVRVGGKQPFTDAASRAPGGTFEHPTFVTAGRLVRELVELPAFNDGIASAPYDSARALFIREEAAMILMGTWILAHIRSDLGPDADAFLDKVDCFEFPAVVDTGTVEPRIVVGGVNSAFAVSGSSPHKDVAFELVRTFVSDLTAQKWAKTGRIPALREDLVFRLVDAHTMKAARLFFNAPDVQHYYDQYLPRALGEVVNDRITDVFQGTLTPLEAAARIQEASQNRDR